jgi:hypothetical protein
MGLMQGVEREKLGDNYSHFVMAGGPIGAVHPKFAEWHKTFWDNLDITVSLHHIKRVVALSHRDCGAAKLAYGADAVAKKLLGGQLASLEQQYKRTTKREDFAEQLLSPAGRKAYQSSRSAMKPTDATPAVAAPAAAAASAGVKFLGFEPGKP